MDDGLPNKKRYFRRTRGFSFQEKSKQMCWSQGIQTCWLTENNSSCTVPVWLVCFAVSGACSYTAAWFLPACRFKRSKPAAFSHTHFGKRITICTVTNLYLQGKIHYLPHHSSTFPAIQWAKIRSLARVGHDRPSRQQSITTKAHHVSA